MAPVNAAKKSRPSASASASTTASRARKKTKSSAAGTGPAGDDASDWTARNEEDAAAEGWGVFPCIDMKTRAQFVEIFYTDARFSNDNLARQHVAARAKAGDALALRAMRAVFRSRVPAKARSK